MDSNREHPLCYLDAETLLVAIYVWVGHGRRYMILSCLSSHALKGLARVVLP
jgi:hypothetical protein